MKRIVILLSSILILFASCSAEIVETLPKAEVVVLDADVRVNGIGRGSFEVMFKPVPFASGYTYDLNSNGIELLPNPVAYANGYCFIEFNNIEQSEGEITLYAIDDTGETHRIGSSPYSLTLQGVSPDAYFSYRDATSAEITVNPVFADKIIVYRIELFDSNGEIVETRELHDIHDSILLTGLGPDAYELILSHGLEGYEMSDSTTHISIPAYDAASAQVVMELDSDGSGFTVVGIPGDVSKLVLWKSASDVGNGIPLDVDIEINGGKASIPFTALKSLEEGYFHVKDENGSYASNIYKCTVPLVNPVIEANFKSAFIAYQFAYDFNPADYELTIKGTSDGSSPVGSFEDSDGDGLVDRVFISGLVSNKPYDGLVIELKNRNTLAILSCPLDESFDTKSFEGTYYWNNAGGKPSNFVVDVVAPETEGVNNSEFPYYVYFNKTDSIFSDPDYSSHVGDRLRISPLIDPAVKGESFPSGMIDCKNPGQFSKANLAYNANGKKWNRMADSFLGSLAIPTKWGISESDVKIDGDSISSITQSVAMGLTVQTRTTFEFNEYDYDGDGQLEAFLKFKNIGYGSYSSTVDGGLFKNPRPDDCLKYGDDSESAEVRKQCWYLEMDESKEVVR